MWNDLAQGIGIALSLLIALGTMVRGIRADKQRDRELAANESKARTENENRRGEVIVDGAVDVVQMLRDQLAAVVGEYQRKFDDVEARAQESQRLQGERIGALELAAAASHEAERLKAITIERMRSATSSWWTELRVWDRSGRNGDMPIPPDEDMKLLNLTPPLISPSEGTDSP